MKMEKNDTVSNDIRRESLDSLTDVTSSSTTTSICDSRDSSQSTPERYTSINKYEEEWHKIYDFYDDNWSELRRRAVVGRLRSSRFRSVCWRALLGVLPHKTSSWQTTLREQRERYSILKNELFSDPRNNKISDDDPLSQKDQSLWHKHFRDQELIAVIKQDVVRTFPGVDFFRRDDIQDIMVSILFCYAREHPAMCYRQGMHEILAPLIFVLYSDHQSMLHFKEHALINDVIVEILNSEYLEHDSFTLFTHIMSGIECCYRINDMMPSSSGYFPVVSKLTCPDSSDHRSENEVVTQLNWIRVNLLAKYDPQLRQHLEELDIPLPLFGIRWLRLLFGREFALLDLLVLWDAVFAEGDNFGLVNYIVVAMLMAIRDELLCADYTTCLTLLMRYPPAVDISYIIEHALHLMHPKIYPLPTATSFITLPSSTSSLPSTTTVSRESIARLKSNSLFDRNSSLKRDARYANSKSLAQMGQSNGGGIIDGFSIEDFNNVRSDLQHAYSVMSLSRLKLLQYLPVLRKTLPPGISHEAMQALDGIQELCTLLKHDASVAPIEDAHYVERAREADERYTRRISINTPQSHSKNNSANNSPSKSNSPSKNTTMVPTANRTINNTTIMRTTKMKPRAEVAMKVFREKEVFSPDIIGAPITDPTGLRVEI